MNHFMNTFQEKKKKFDKLRFDDSMRKDKSKKTGGRKSQIGDVSILYCSSDTIRINHQAMNYLFKLVRKHFSYWRKRIKSANNKFLRM